jgi:hypothetical protein
MKNRFFTFYALSILASSSIFAQQVKSIENVGLGNISVIEFGSNGDIWVGSNGQGAAVYKASVHTWMYFNTGNTPQMLSDTVTSLALAPLLTGARTYIGTTNGIAVSDSLGWYTVSALPSARVSGVLLTSTDSLWVFTEYNGIAIYDSAGQNSLGTLNSGNSHIPNDSIVCSQGGSEGCGTYCAGTANHGCFWTADGDSFTIIDTSVAGHKLVDNRVTCTFMEQQCMARLVGTKGGLSACPPGIPCESFTSSNSALPENYITAIAEDCTGQIWIGTKDSGVILFHLPNTFGVRITTANGLTSNQIVSITFQGCSVDIATADGNIAEMDSLGAVVGELTGIISEAGKELPDVRVFPQPANNLVHFAFQITFPNSKMLISDLTGNTIQTYNCNGSQGLDADVSELADGIYFYRLVSGSEIVKTGKLQIAR